jgi:hypothetical protein
MKKLHRVLVAAGVLLLAGGGYGYSEFNRKAKDITDEKPHVSVTAKELLLTYEKDTLEFSKNIDKVIVVTGTVKNIEAAENPVVISLGNRDDLSSVQCSMDSSHAASYRNIKEGAALTLKGICTGGRTDDMFGTDVILNRCVIIQ